MFEPVPGQANPNATPEEKAGYTAGWRNILQNPVNQAMMLAMGAELMRPTWSGSFGEAASNALRAGGNVAGEAASAEATGQQHAETLQSREAIAERYSSSREQAAEIRGAATVEAANRRAFSRTARTPQELQLSNQVYRDTIKQIEAQNKSIRDAVAAGLMKPDEAQAQIVNDTEAKTRAQKAAEDALLAAQAREMMTGAGRGGAAETGQTGQSPASSGNATAVPAPSVGSGAAGAEISTGGTQAARKPTFQQFLAGMQRKNIMHQLQDPKAIERIRGAVSDPEALDAWLARTRPRSRPRAGSTGEE